MALRRAARAAALALPPPGLCGDLAPACAIASLAHLPQDDEEDRQGLGQHQHQQPRSQEALQCQHQQCQHAALLTPALASLGGLHRPSVLTQRSPSLLWSSSHHHHNHHHLQQQQQQLRGMAWWGGARSKPPAAPTQPPAELTFTDPQPPAQPAPPPAEEPVVAAALPTLPEGSPEALSAITGACDMVEMAAVEAAMTDSVLLGAYFVAWIKEVHDLGLPW